MDKNNLKSTNKSEAEIKKANSSPDDPTTYPSETQPKDHPKDMEKVFEGRLIEKEEIRSRAINEERVIQKPGETVLIIDSSQHILRNEIPNPEDKWKDMTQAEVTELVKKNYADIGQTAYVTSDGSVFSEKNKDYAEAHSHKFGYKLYKVTI